MTNKTIIVSGGTGNLGGRIIKALLNKGVEVWVLMSSSSNKRSTFKLYKKSSIKITDDELRFRQK